MAPSGPRAATPLIEREVERRELGDLLSAAVGGRGSVAVVEGPAGIGKTRLLGEARELASDHGIEPLVARGARLESQFGFGVARQLFEHRVASPPPRVRGRLFDGAASLAAAPLGLEHLLTDPTASTPDPEFAALHGLYWLSANLAADEPLLLEVDDAQWADRPSLRFLAYLAHRIAELPILLVIAVRAGEPSQLDEWLEAIGATGARLRPRPLTEAATAELVTASFENPPERGFVSACHRTSAGNPFLLSALIRTLLAGGVKPIVADAALVEQVRVHEISAAVSSRLAALPAAARDLGAAVAVLGNDVALEPAARLAALTDDEAAAAADALTEADILTPTRPLEFVHPLVRTAVYERIPAAQRALSHGRAAMLLDGPGTDPERVAAHLLSAEPGTVPPAVAALKRAAGRALERGSPTSASRYLERVLEEPVSGAERGAILHQLGGLELRSGNPASIDHLGEALDMTPAGPGRADVARELSLALVPGGRYRDAIAVLERALDDLGNADRELALQIEAEIGTESMLSAATVPAAIERLVGLRDEVAAAATPGRRAALGTIAILEASGAADAERAAESASLALAGGLLDDQGPDSHVFYNVPFPLVLADRFDDAAAALDAALAEARRRGSRLGVARANAFRAGLGLRRGALADAEMDACASIEAATPLWVVRQMSTGWLIEILIERGELEEAASQLEEAGLDGELADILMHNFPLLSRARLKLALGDPAAAIDDLRELDRRERDGRARNPAWFAHRALLAEALLRVGDDRAAIEAATEEVELARRWGAPRALGIALRALGLAASGEERVARLNESADVLEDSGAELERARALVDLGAELRRGGRRKDSREPLRHGMEIAHRCGAAPLAERAREELVAGGSRPRRMVRSGVDALTPSELRVARMAATGMTNREIAQALFVTLRTVEVHLTHTYSKLDIASRDGLPEALAVPSRTS